MKTWYRFIVPLLAVLVLAARSQEKQASTKPSVEKSSSATSSRIAAPTFTLQDAQGQSVSLSDYRGKVIILDFWATWCPPCRQEIPHFIELQKQYGGQGLQVVGVSVDQKGWEVVRPFIASAEINYPVLMYTEAVYNAYQELIPEDMRGGIPFTFILDMQGKVVTQFVGYRDKAVFEEVIKPLLGS